MIHRGRFYDHALPCAESMNESCFQCWIVVRGYAMKDSEWICSSSPWCPFGVSGVCEAGDLMMEGCNYSSLYTYHACMHHTHKLLYSLTNVINIHIIQSYVLSLLFSLYVMCADKPCIVQLMTRLLYATCIRWI